MRAQIRPAIIMLVLLTVITGLIYPLLVTGIAQVVFPKQANGSLILKDGQAIGSELIGQPFDDPKYFWGRLSATSPVPYNAAATLILGSSPLPELVTRSTGIGCVFVGSAAFKASMRPCTSAINAGLVGPRFDPDEAAAL